MKPSSQGSARIWWVAGLVASLMIAAVVLLLSVRRTPSPALPPANQPMPDSAGSPQIGLTRVVQEAEGNLVAAEAHFLDPTPLFLPTEWNSGQNVLPANVLRDPGQMFQDYPSRLAYTEESLKMSFPDKTQVPIKSEDTISLVNDRLRFQGIGRGDFKPEKLTPRGGFIEVSMTDTGERVLTEAVPTNTVSDGNWRPLEFLGVINAAGLVGRLTFLQSSGVVEVDAFYRDYLEKNLHLGERLGPGFYRISVGP